MLWCLIPLIPSWPAFASMWLSITTNHFLQDGNAIIALSVLPQGLTRYTYHHHRLILFSFHLISSLTSFQVAVPHDHNSLSSLHPLIQHAAQLIRSLPFYFTSSQSHVIPLTSFQVAVLHDDLLRVGDAHTVRVGAVRRGLGLDPPHHDAVTVLNLEMHLWCVAAERTMAGVAVHIGKVRMSSMCVSMPQKHHALVVLHFGMDSWCSTAEHTIVWV